MDKLFIDFVYINSMELSFIAIPADSWINFGASYVWLMSLGSKQGFVGLKGYIVNGLGIEKQIISLGMKAWQGHVRKYDIWLYLKQSLCVLTLDSCG